MEELKRQLALQQQSAAKQLQSLFFRMCQEQAGVREATDVRVR